MGKKCRICNIEKDLTEFPLRNKNTGNHRTECCTCYAEIRKKYKNNPERNRLDQKKHYKNNKEKVLLRVKMYKQSKKDVPQYKLMKSIRRRMYNFFKNNTFNKKSNNDLIGCSQLELKEYIQSKFIDDMTWNNYGYYGWHLDHKIPLSSAKTVDELYSLCHYTNFQPLWWQDNLSKGNKIPNIIKI